MTQEKVASTSQAETISSSDEQQLSNKNLYEDELSHVTGGDACHIADAGAATAFATCVGAAAGAEYGASTGGKHVGRDAGIGAAAGLAAGGGSIRGCC